MHGLCKSAKLKLGSKIKQTRAASKFGKNSILDLRDCVKCLLPVCRRLHNNYPLPFQWTQTSVFDIYISTTASVFYQIKVS